MSTAALTALEVGETLYERWHHGDLRHGKKVINARASRVKRRGSHMWFRITIEEVPGGLNVTRLR